MKKPIEYFRMWRDYPIRMWNDYAKTKTKEEVTNGMLDGIGEKLFFLSVGEGFLNGGTAYYLTGNANIGLAVGLGTPLARTLQSGFAYLKL